MARRRLIGTVTSVKMAETALVTIETMRRHPLYGKRYRQTTKFAAHNPSNAYRLGDVVEIEEHRPFSKTKHFLIRRRLSAAPPAVAELAEERGIAAETDAPSAGHETTNEEAK